MKKFRLVLIIMFCIILVGCGSKTVKLKDKDAALNYLKANYPEESFEIISEEERSMNSSTCQSKLMGKSWIVKELNTNIEFELSNEYNFNTFTCEYKIKDEYFRGAIKKFLEENKFRNVESHDTCYNCIGYEFKKENFNGASDMLNSINEVIDKMNNTRPFKYKNLHSYIYFYFNNEHDTVCLEDIEKGKYKLNDIVNKIYSK